MKKININDIYQFKSKHKKFAAITAYDATFANLFFSHGIKVILIGDSLGMTVQGHCSTIPVKMEDMIYHTKCVRRGAPYCFLIADLPFMSYFNVKDALKNASKLMQSGANMVKLEGGDKILEIVHQLNINSIPVCGHIGLTPQSINMYGSYKIQGKKKSEIKRLINEATLLEKSGVKLLVLECIVQNLSKVITEKLKIPTIGIGSGSSTDGQILVMHDILGITCGKIPSFAKNFLLNNSGIPEAIELYVQEVENKHFPHAQHSFN
ncbi:3-methyl-2-oxobutanoate hydroxymethyltransferase [Wigglesworthia glossinidia endosymbiont of Glossina morsitans morsitans (Yale colony)]|uniref:3-methyl-2-oxobutanoate hydroxymethyltransferase n=1 Tax=Wigglesworthia glossinidia endosymbiont of Glossina morsitans morsitans (Yale colony) TaxID=1142511 RepID=H6Q5V2_WIGGL|nr:3-methyl-2-oxobutanoate hydroxymethyltransferase [Wigglesworthia glossinidia]AFA41148.1 3-methyl-2-oxobutanoate hydroxymethyltransferase [Wigglesworthia glossinidia endosymbiont of Glossina morsitans morsitans (Yale colony)]